ncbi:hypothetical protein ACOME3_009844 [Neoechinorhynchus agilis]
MFEGLIASILNRFFSGYIDEIDYKNLQIGLISGSVELKNLSLRHDAFFQFDVPIEVRCSRVGRLHVRVPWRSIYAEPVVISIEDVYVLASPMSTKSMHDPEKMTQVSIAAKRKQVKALNRGITVDDERQVDRGFFKTLVDTVLNNIQIHVKNVHIRYEDSLSLNSVFLFAGVTLEQVLVTTTDADGKQIQLDSEAEFVFKVGKVNDFNVYFNAIRSSSGASSDCLLSCKQVSSADVIESLRNAIASSSMCGIQFENLLRRPLSVTATLRLNRFRQQESLMKPHITLDATLDVIDFSLSVDQFISMKALVDHYRIVLRNSHYVKYRPKISVQDSPREWWKYAYTSIVEERIRSYNWERIKLYRHQYRQYKKLYQQAIKSHEIQDGIANEMDTLEITLNLPTIMIARQHAKIECKKVSKDVVYNLTNEEKEELYRMIGFNEQVGSDDRALTELSAQLSLQSISFELRNSDTKLLIHAELNSISSNFAIQPMIKSGIFQIEFDSMAVAMDDGSGNHVSILRSIYSVDDKANLNKFMHLKFKKHSINSDSIADYDVSFGLLTVEFVYEYAAINNVLAALKSSAILEMITNAASQNLARLSNYSTAGLIYAIENHKRFMVNALIYSPIIVIPQGGTRGGPGIVTYLGKVELTSDLTPSNINDHSQLSKNMYDRFNLHLTNAQILMCDTNSEHIFDRIENDNKLCDKSDEWRILEPANLDAVLLLSIRPNCYSLPQLIIKSNINDIDFIVSDETMIALHKFIIDLPLPSISTPSVRESIQYEHDVFYDPSYDTLTNSLKAKENEKKLSLKQKVEISTPLPAETDDVWSNCFLGEESHYTELRENYTKYMLRFVMRKATIHVRESKNVPYLRLGMEGLNCDLAMTVFGVAGSISVGALRVFDVQ